MTTKASLRTRQYRRKVKKRMIEAMGGCCQICKYNKSISALGFHHLDPKEKDFSFATGNNRSWKILVKELEKCILLCHNCHSEVHEGITKIPSVFQKFDESYRNWFTEDEINNKISQSLKGIKQDIVKCPKCNLSGGIRAMKRYHFDNCKKI